MRMTTIRLPVLIAVAYHQLTFARVIGINTTPSLFLTPLYHFGPKQIAFFYTTHVTAALLGHHFGHFLHDAITTHHQRRHAARLDPDARLLVLFSTPSLLAGLLLLAFALQNAYHSMLTALGWGLYVFGIIITTVNISAYILDSHPEGSGEVAAWLNVARTTGGFLAGYFQIEWARALGTKRGFAVQAGVCAGVCAAVFSLVRVYGKRLRGWSGQPRVKIIWVEGWRRGKGLWLA
ncbi:Major facilitator superfamily domain, general substrate transporter [Lasallia pustulata]|uniref:Major facilitator superfamily domain, general substrate transporter n=1 Tax=Lasallia pustulata TaxID=136370 RepID=A0A1W5D828_9LECA|nr:Major facilitator superfamily domain, general substrate transporter [Lasallia pustulata]